MRNKKIAAYLCIGLLLTTVGCSNSNANSDVSTAETINFNDVINTNAEENNSDHQNNKENVDNQQDSAEQSNIQSSNEDSAQQSNSELDGNIESIGDNSVVINKTFHPSENTAVSYGDSDIEKQQGAFSDLNQGANINMAGYYDGNDFYAKHVIIYNYV